MFNFNEMFYTGSINATEQEKLNIGLWLGYYIITAEYKGCKLSNNINILSVLAAEHLTMRCGVLIRLLLLYFTVKEIVNRNRNFQNQQDILSKSHSRVLIRLF